MNDVFMLIMWVAVSVFAFFSGAAWGAIRALKVTTNINIHGETVTLNREATHGFCGIKPPASK